MITVKDINNETKSGLFGNQLFKYCVALAFSIDNNTNFELPPWHFTEYLKYPPKLLNQPNVNFMEADDYFGQWYIKIPNAPYVNLPGYYQDLRYFDHQKPQIVEGLQLNDYYQTKFQKLLENDLPNWRDLNLAFLHVRRGDYLGLSNILPIPGKSYYDKAISLSEYDKCLVFSNDLPWCKQNFDYPNLVYLNYTDRYFDMYIMTLCQTGILANSTFSWFGAYLNKNDPKIFVPRIWFGPVAVVGENTYEHTKVKPKEWIEL